MAKTLTYIKVSEEEEEEKKKAAAVPRDSALDNNSQGPGRDGTSVFWAFWQPSTQSLTFRGKDKSKTYQPSSGASCFSLVSYGVLDAVKAPTGLVAP